MAGYVAATVVLWAISGFAAVAAAVVLAAASTDSHRGVRAVGHTAIVVTRGVPTSLVVVIAGLVALRASAPPWLPDLFPDTPEAMALVAWSVVAALAYGSVGHLAVIFRTAARSLGPHRLEQLRAMGLPAPRRLAVLMRESAPAALAPCGARLVHHLHNTAFAALFPVADLFGWVQDRVNTTFEVTHYALIGAATYVVLSGVIWAAVRALEAAVSPPVKAGGGRSGPLWRLGRAGRS